MRASNGSLYILTCSSLGFLPMAFLPSTTLERDAVQEEQLLVDAADFLCPFWCRILAQKDANGTSMKSLP